MNLREKIEKEITEKVMIKLASERVELANIGQYEREAYGQDIWVDQLTQWADRIDKTKKELEKAVENAEFVNKEALKGIQKVIGQEASIEKAIKDLGLSAPTDYEKAKKRIRDIQKDVKSLGKKIKA